MSVRYALYLAPPSNSHLWRFGCRVLGYDPETGENLPQARLRGWEPDAVRAVTEDPRRYGFHGTVKAPFRLADGVSEADLAEALRRFAAARSRFVLQELAVEAVRRRPGADGFVALVEPRPTPALLDLERAAVADFEPFRAPLTPAERARRRPESLSERQRHNLDRWGYPYVFEEFRFHLTLAGHVPGEDLDRLADAFRALHAEEVGPGPVSIEDLALFRQVPGERFRMVLRARFES